MSETIRSEELPPRLAEALNVHRGEGVDYVVQADGSVTLTRTADARKETLDEIRARLAPWVGSARHGLTTDEIMAMTRGDD